MKNLSQFKKIIALMVGVIGIFSVIFTACKTEADETVQPIMPELPFLEGNVTFIFSGTIPAMGVPITAAYHGNGSGDLVWQWYRVTPVVEIELTETGNTYIPVAEDAGFLLRAMVGFAGQSGTWSATTTQFVIRTPDAPHNFTATTGVSGSVTLSWTEPEDNGGSAITGYEVSSDNSETWVPISNANTLTYTFNTLTNGISYIFQIRAVNAAGKGITASTSATLIAPPSAPQDFTATPDNGQVVLAWTAPADDGGSTITGYEVSNNSGSTWTTPPYSTSHTFSGLTNGTTYYFQVRAINAAGNGTPATANATPITTPSVPQNFRVVQSDNQATLSWAAPESAGGSPITEYQVSSNGGSMWEIVTSGTNYTFSNIYPGTTYYFQVRAINTTGNGTPASTGGVSFVDINSGAPGAVQTFTATPGDRQVTLAWASPGGMVTGYQVYDNSEGAWITPTSNTGHTVYNLNNGTSYTFRVRAQNDNGNGMVAIAIATPYTTPGMPQGFTATPGNGHVTLTWAAPASNGGSMVTKYEVSSNNGSSWVTAFSDTSHVFSDLTNGRDYYFQVRAINAAGDGTAASASATPLTTPGMPQSFTATPGDGQVALSWASPVNNGGSLITGYEVSRDNGSTWTTLSSYSGDTSYTFTGLTNGLTYTFQVRALNAAGNGTAATTTAIPGVAPSEPQNFTAIPGDRQVLLTWTAPENQGDSAIIRYEVSRDNGSTWIRVYNTSHVVSDLSNGTSYTFQVRAVNSNGIGTETTTTATPGTTVVPSDPPSNTTVLTMNQWRYDEFTYYGESELWYTFYATGGTTYYIWWNDGAEGNGAQTLNIKVSAEDSNGNTIFYETDNGWYAPQYVTVDSSGTIYLRVQPYYYGGTGTFGIAYTTSYSRP